MLNWLVPEFIVASSSDVSFDDVAAVALTENDFLACENLKVRLCLV